MGSYSQMIVGGMLLVVAFFFGRYINQQPIIQTPVIAEVNELVSAIKPVGSSATVDVGAPQKTDQQQTLRDRILSQRNDRTADSEYQVANAVESKQTSAIPTQDFHDAMVEPDFSHLSFGNFSNPIPEPNEILPQPKFPPPAPDVMTRQDRIVTHQGRFTINRRSTDRLPLNTIDDDFTRPRPNVSQRFQNRHRDRYGHGFESQQQHFSRQPQRQPQPQRGPLVLDNPRYRMVPVRERAGRWNPEPKEYVSYNTVFGDTLHNLSTKFFGTPDRYLEIYLANRQLFESPSEVPVNTEIRIPVAK